MWNNQSSWWKFWTDLMSSVWNFCRLGADVFISRCLYWQGARGDGCFHRLTNIGWISWPWCEFHKHFQPSENSPAIKKSPATQNDGNGCPFLHAAIIAKMKATRWNKRPKTINAITTPFQSENKMALLQVFLRLVFTSNRVRVRIVGEVARVLMTLWKSKIKVVSRVINATDSKSEESECFQFLLIFPPMIPTFTI